MSEPDDDMALWAVENGFRDELEGVMSDHADLPFEDLLRTLAHVCGEVFAERLIAHYRSPSGLVADVAGAVAHTINHVTHGMGQTLGRVAYAQAVPTIPVPTREHGSMPFTPRTKRKKKL